MAAPRRASPARATLPLRATAPPVGAGADVPEAGADVPAAGAAVVLLPDAAGEAADEGWTHNAISKVICEGSSPIRLTADEAPDEGDAGAPLDAVGAPEPLVTPLLRAEAAIAGMLIGSPTALHSCSLNRSVSSFSDVPLFESTSAKESDQPLVREQHRHWHLQWGSWKQSTLRLD